MSTGTFDFDAGELCLDFANTVEWHASDEPDDMLDGYDDLICWADAAGILSTGRADHLRRVAQEEAEAARGTFAAAVRLREAIYRIFTAVADEKTVAAADLTLLNAQLARALPHLQIAVSSPDFTWEWTAAPDDLDQIVWPIARSAAGLLTGDNLDRVGQCADDRGCGYLFVDNSRNRSRRWCSMESCGNRAKARRHYRRHRDDQA